MAKLTASDFKDLLDKTFEHIDYVLVQKAVEYADPNDRMHNFNIAAELEHTTPVGALGGMMVKHTVSVYDMIEKHRQSISYPMSAWDEKIIDHINYLILLKALLVAEDMDRAVTEEKVING